MVSIICLPTNLIQRVMQNGTFTPANNKNMGLGFQF
jgi:hypothetical protein